MSGEGDRAPKRPFALAVCLLIVLPGALVGCARKPKPEKASASKGKDDKKPPLPPSVEYGAGHTVVYQSDTSPLPSFSLAWAKGGAGIVGGQVKTGHLEEPRGHIYADGKPSSTYRGDTGDADRDATRLNVDGHVVLRSIDGKQTLRAPHAEYRGDVKLIRATGGVAASGTFGTLSGVPELWATPDLNIIGTPDMVSQKLKIPALVALAATAATGSARLQKGTTYDYFNGKGPILAEKLTKNGTIVGYRTTLRPGAQGPIRFMLPDRGLTLESSGQVVIDLAANGQDVRHVTAAGSVHVVQTDKGGIVTTLDGKDAVYDWKDKADTTDLTLSGPVTIVRNLKAKNRSGAMVPQTTTLKGDRGSAVLVKEPLKGQDPLRSAILVGNVALDVSPVDGQSFSGTGSRMVYAPKDVDTATVDVVGAVRLTRVSKDVAGAATTVITRGGRGNVVLNTQPSSGANPLKIATLNDDVTIDASGASEERFQASGDRLVTETLAEGKTKATLTGALKISGKAQDFVGDLSNADTAVVMIGSNGWETVETSNSGGERQNGRINIPERQPKATKPPKKGGGR